MTATTRRSSAAVSSSSSLVPSRAVAIAVQPYLCGGLASSLSCVAIHPIDLVKVHVQIASQSGNANITGVKAARSVLAKEGVSGFYSGLSAAIARQMVYGTARLGMHRALSDHLIARRVAKGESATLPLIVKSVSAMTTGALAAAMGCPMDVALVRMQADSLAKVGERRGYANVLDAIVKMAKSEGVTTLWRGSVPLIARGTAINVGMMATYDQTKEVFSRLYGQTGFVGNAVASGISGFACAFTSLPFDLVKSRLMNMKVDPLTGKFPYAGVVDCFRQIVVHEGPTKLWRGYWTYCVRCAPNTMMILLLLEHITSTYNSMVRGVVTD
uniref:Mitochondrial 2-oxoglutarate/malate carrier protein n=1 Tax=Globisporangium ultimum (strain ATCC 200006 / CBS 805.95 / DAOM BR144) TaxID=431595 RepID=K3WJA2_GLOUD